MDDQEVVWGTLEEYASAYCAKDADRLMALFDEGDDISLIGTGADELCAGHAAIKEVFLRNFSEATATQFEWNWQHVTVTNGCAVVAATPMRALARALATAVPDAAGPSLPPTTPRRCIVFAHRCVSMDKNHASARASTCHILVLLAL